MARTATILPVHGKLWYDEPLYRIAWLVLPQAVVLLLVAGLFWGRPVDIVNGGGWGEPVDSKQHEDRIGALRDKAGAEGDKAALSALQKLSDNGDPMASFKLATLYDPNFASSYSKAGLNDPAKAIDLYNIGLSVLRDKAERNLAVLYLDSKFNTLNPKLGCAYATKHSDVIRKDAETGGGWFLTKVADCYWGYVEDSGRTPATATPEDHKKALELNKVAIQLGGYSIAATQLFLGRIYEFGVTSIPKDLVQARSYYEACAAQNEVICLQRMGAFYDKGLGNLVKNEEKARQYFEQASKIGDAFSDSMLGLYYAHGLSGLSKDPVKAIEYWIKAAERGEPWALEALSYAYFYGQGNLKKNTAMAVDLLLKAIDAKSATVAENLRNNFSIADRDFWLGLQKGLFQRKAYDGPIDGKPSEDLLKAIRKLIQS